MTLASRMSRIAPSPTLRVTAEADRLRRQGIDVVDLGAGEPDFPTPEHIKAAAHAAIDANFTKYTPSAGVKELRDAVCLRYRADYGVEFKAEEVIITAGAKQALYNAAMALFEDGDEVITHAPFWPTIPEQIKLAGATPVIVQTHAEDGFTIHAQPIIDAITPRTKGVVINSPCNPTGALIVGGGDRRHCRCGGAARAVDCRGRHLREAGLRRGTAQPGPRPGRPRCAIAPSSAAPRRRRTR